MPGDLPDAAQIVTLTWTPDGRAFYASDPRVRIPFSATEALTAVHADDEEWIVYPDVSASGVAQAAQRSAARREWAAESASKVFAPRPALTGQGGQFRGQAQRQFAVADCCRSAAA